MIRSVVFLETEEQLNAFMQALGDNSGNVQCIAVFPGVYEKARQAGLAVRPLDDFGHVASLASYSAITIAKIEHLTTLFDPLWDSLTAAIHCARCVSFRAFFHTLKGYYDALFKRALPVQHALEHLCPDQVWVFPTHYEVTGFSLLDRPALGLTSLLVPLIAAHTRTAAVFIDMPGTTPSYCLPSVPHSSVPFATACKLLAHGEQVDGTPTSVQHNTLLTHTYILEELDSDFVRQLHQEGIRVQSATPPDVATQIPSLMRKQLCQSVAHKVVDDFLAQEGLAEQWIVDGIDFSPLLVPYINALLRAKLADMLFISYSAYPFYRSFERSVLLSGGMAFESFVLTKAARRAGLRTINYHRGTLGCTATPTLERYDLAEAEFFLVNGKGAAQNYAQPCADALWPEGYSRAQPIVVGLQVVWNVLQQGPRRALPSRNPLKICYLLETDIGDYGYMGSHVRPSFLHYATVRSVVDIFSQYPDVQLSIKEYPQDRFRRADNGITEYIRTLNAPNITVLAPCSVASIADDFDVFILDYPGTPLLELSASGKTIVLYIDEESYVVHENAQKILANCSHYFKKLEDFLQFINRCCQEPSVLTTKSMHEFLCTFVLPSLTQSPSSNMQKFIQHLIKV